ncbi:MAG: arylsulfotransferase family protein [Planctomycetota bacterium]
MFPWLFLAGCNKSARLAAGGVILLLALLPACSREGTDTLSQQKSSHDEEELSAWDASSAREDADQPAAGRWRKYRTNKFEEGLSQEQREAMEQLETIGYASGSAEAKNVSGVVRHVSEEACAGFNFFTSGHAQAALLMDMKGRVLHEWSNEFWKIWPGYPTEKSNVHTQFWRRAHLFENGDILVIYEGLGLVKLDKDSGVIWSNPGKMHHDLQVMPDGDIYVLTREARMEPRLNPKAPILEDFISILDAGGKEKERISVLECFQNSKKFRDIWRGKAQPAGDLFHTNTVLVLDGRLESRSAAFKKGHLLISLRQPNLIAVVSLEQKKIVWALKGDFRKQHDPKILENGNMLLFDNGGQRNASKVIEFDPLTRDVAWCYSGREGEPFYSKTCGTAERLINGNTLITESDMGRAFEVTPDKKIVWEFFNPYHAGQKREYIATLFEVIRLKPEFPVSWAQNRLE